tara:strand:+ start:2433 stop:2648 length:216 start_codon:yes stop_codon:yes gene_type:complete
MKIYLSAHEMMEAIFNYTSKKTNLNTIHMSDIDFVNDDLQQSWECDEDSFDVDGVFVNLKEETNSTGDSER